MSEGNLLVKWSTKQKLFQDKAKLCEVKDKERFLKTWREGDDIFKVLEERKKLVPTRILQLTKLSFRNEWTIKYFLQKPAPQKFGRESYIRGKRIITTIVKTCDTINLLSEFTWKGKKIQHYYPTSSDRNPQKHKDK